MVVSKSNALELSLVSYLLRKIGRKSIRGLRANGSEAWHKRGDTNLPDKTNAPESSPISCRRKGGEHPGPPSKILPRYRRVSQMSHVCLFSDLTAAISKDRLGPYRSIKAPSKSEASGIYAWNIALCESLYPSLHGVEIALRNSIHAAASVKFGNELWFSGRLKKPEEERLKELRRKVDHSGTKSLTGGDLVSGLSLGFWVDLLKGRYEPLLWPALLPDVFPYATKKQRAREHAYQRLVAIQKLRNRVFHHEPFWHMQELE